MFPYIQPETFERRSRFDATDFDLDASAWQTVLTEAIAEESAFVRTIAVRGGFEDARFASLSELHGTYPEVRRAVVRLVRDNVMGALSDGLDTESVGSGASGSGGQYDYQASSELRDEVRDELESIDWERDISDGDGSGHSVAEVI